ncbi:MAG TPA: methylmalonyl-CoA epimerase [Actinobacteria bacterium]|jgi:hypothetical protein|nr:methylmalonyl-CoA epimerase [Actinomycetota bacterium]
MGWRHRSGARPEQVELAVITPPLLRHPVMQHAFVVADLDAGIETWRSTLGAGPFVVIRDFVGQELTYRGAPSATAVDYAFGQSGDIQVQLIAQSDPGPSIYRDMYAAGQGGFHHVCALVPMDDWDRQLRVFLEAGYEIASSLMTSAPAVYLDCRADLGCFVELYGRTERSEGFFAHLRDLHEGWDGITDPIRQR